MDPKLKAFLDLIGWSEGTSLNLLTKNSGYDVIVDGPGGHEVFTSYAAHPFANRAPKIVRENPHLASTAAGRYQLLCRYWRFYCQKLRLTDFSPASQDAIALQQIKECGATDLILTGSIDQAITRCRSIWASFPGNSYGQGGHSMATLLAKYNEFLPKG